MIAALAVAPWLTACPKAEQGPLREGAPAPQVSGKTMEDRYIALTDFRGQVVLVNLWATWCAPCRQELPELVHLHESLSERGFSVLGINTDAQGQDTAVRKMIVEQRLVYPNLRDPQASIATGLGISGYPTSFLVGRDGIVRWVRKGLIRKNDAELARALTDALAEVSAPAE